MELHGIYGPSRKEELLGFLNEYYNIIPLDNQINFGERREVPLELIHTQAEANIKQLATNTHLLFMNRHLDETQSL